MLARFPALCLSCFTNTPPNPNPNPNPSPTPPRMLTACMKLCDQAGLLDGYPHARHPPRHPRHRSPSPGDDDPTAFMSVDGGNAGDAATRGASPGDGASDEGVDGWREAAALRGALVGIYRECLRDVLVASR